MYFEIINVSIFTSWKKIYKVHGGENRQWTPQTTKPMQFVFFPLYVLQSGNTALHGSL